MFDTDFHSVDFQTRISPFINLGSDTGVKKAPVHIKTGAWIGGFSIILKGVTIGENSVVGAGSVVTKNIPDNEVWAGNPAVFIKALK
ncbi:galactoside O-acetyltransferase [Vibrio sp. JCM 19236]|nr:galactoside O-acetyltransferase [Vibrio sp. JCM 19236]